MTDEEIKVIETLKEDLKVAKTEDVIDIDVLTGNLEIVLNLIENQEKMIDEMAEYLASIDFDEHCREIPCICLNCPDKDDLEGNMNCIKHYFEQKASKNDN